MGRLYWGFPENPTEYIFEKNGLSLAGMAKYRSLIKLNFADIHQNNLDYFG